MNKKLMDQHHCSNNIQPSSTPMIDNNKPPSTFLGRHGKKISVLAVWAAVVIYLIIDQVTKPCDNFETNTTRVQRLNKAHAPLFINNHNHNHTINCDATPGKPSPYHLSNADNRCHFLDACVTTALNHFVLWVALNPALGAVVLALVYIVAVVLFIPGSILTLGAGASFAAALGFSLGILVASISVFIGASVGSILAFFLGRYVLHDFVQTRLIQKVDIFQAVDDAITEVPLTIMLLLRLSPLVPFNALNYIMSGTNIPTQSYVVGLLGMIPATVAYVFVGASIHGAATAGMESNSVNTILFSVGGVTAFVAVVLISYFAKKKLQQRIGTEKPNSQEKEVGGDNATMIPQTKLLGRE